MCMGDREEAEGDGDYLNQQVPLATLSLIEHDTRYGLHGACKAPWR